MVSRNTLNQYLADLLSSKKMNDYCPNGLQVQGKDDIKVLVTGVTASKALLEKAVELKADAVLVHHGYFWKSESPCITGMKYHRLATLMENQISLFAYHLPLDVHLEYGNNAQLGKLLGIDIEGQFLMEGHPLIFYGQLPSAMNIKSFNLHLENTLNRKPLWIKGGEKQTIQKVAWCTGAGQSFMEQVVGLDFDAYLTGEVSENTVHTARENEMHFFACGHHATERYGVKALGEFLAEEFSLEHHFVDIDNPV